MRMKYDQARTLCHDQLTVLEETKFLLERETERNGQLERVILEIRATSKIQSDEITTLHSHVAQKESEANELR